LILDRIYKGVNEKLSKASPFKRAIFDFAFNYKRTWMRRGFTTPLIDR
jgi:long-chain acyl-CoA synthetase